MVTDALLARHYPSVSRRLVNNPGARVSANGFAIVLAQAEADPELAVDTGIRVDLPLELRNQLLRSATEAVRARLLSRAPPHLFEEIRSAIAAASAGAGRQMAKVRDFQAARHFVDQLNKHGQLNETALLDFARKRKYEETVAALAVLSQSTVDVIRPLMQSLRDDGILIPCRVAGLGWDTVAAVLESRFASGAMGPHELTKAKGAFAKLTWRTRAGCCDSGRCARRRRRRGSIEVRDGGLSRPPRDQRYAARPSSALRCFSRGITSCFNSRSELCQASGLCL